MKASILKDLRSSDQEGKERRDVHEKRTSPGSISQTRIYKRRGPERSAENTCYTGRPPCKTEKDIKREVKELHYLEHQHGFGVTSDSQEQVFGGLCLRIAVNSGGGERNTSI